MSDQALEWIVDQLRIATNDPHKHFMWCTDENALNGLAQVRHDSLQVVTNRWDVAEQAKARELKTTFSDFDFTNYVDNSLDGFFYRISKEKPLVNHLLNQAWRCLKMDGQLWLAGFKNDGVKTYIDKIAALLGSEKIIKKSGQVYTAQFIKKSPFDPLKQLETSDYPFLRPIALQSGLHLLSKPGPFGWNKVDAGSELLIAQLARIHPNLPAPATCLDLGCGYGFLTIAAAQHIKPTNPWILTDNNAAALFAATENLRLNGLNGQVIGADAGAGIGANADLLLCNPPFHQGFSVDGDLTDKFLASASRLLARDGAALFVVNQFIPLERKAAPHFRHIKPLADNGSFKVVLLSHRAHLNDVD
jgi:16S rRNA (guanine1207-N2)-methyltransferase